MPFVPKFKKSYRKEAKWTPEHPETQKLLELYADGVEPKEICRRMGFSRQRFYQIMDMLAFRYGVDIPEFGGEVTYSLAATAKLIGVSGTQWVQTRLHLLDEADLLKTGTGRLRIRHSGVRKLEEMANITIKCAACGKEFKPKQRRSTVCSPNCRYTLNTQVRHQQRGFVLPEHESIIGDVKAAVAALPDPPDGEWMTVGGIATKTDCRLSHMQLQWLKIRQALPIKLSDDRTWRSRPVELVNTSHVAAAEQVYAAYGRI